MSAIGTKRTLASAPHMSAFGGKADIPRCPGHARSSQANYLVVELSLTRKW